MNESANDTRKDSEKMSGKSANTTIHTIKEVYLCRGNNPTNRVETVGRRAVDFGEDALEEMVQQGHFKLFRDKSTRPTIRAYVRLSGKRETVEALEAYLCGDCDV